MYANAPHRFYEGYPYVIASPSEPGLTPADSLFP